MEYLVHIDTVEQDGDTFNHLLKLVIKGEEYLISFSTKEKLGKENSRRWVLFKKLRCEKVTTVTGKVNLCNGE